MYIYVVEKNGKQLVLIFDDEDRNIPKDYSLYHNKRTGYFTCRSKTDKKAKPIYLHRLIGKVPKGKVGDHINGDQFDFRRSNIDPIEQKPNTEKQRKTLVYAGKATSSEYKGVHKAKDNKWYACIRTNDVLLNLGYYDTAELSATVYDTFALILFTRTNLNHAIVTYEDLAQVDFAKLIRNASKNLSNHGKLEDVAKLDGLTQADCLSIWMDMQERVATI